MNLADIRKMPVMFGLEEWHRAQGSSGLHESCFRSYHVMEKARGWARLGAPASVILEMIEDAYYREPSEPGSRPSG